MSSLIQERLQKAFYLYDELAEHLDESALKLKLSNLPSNTIGQQLWCVVGARESYINGIVKGSWAGFSCSLKVTDKKKEVSEALKNSAQFALKTLSHLQEMTMAQQTMAIELLEHEIQHQGQLIRYLYGMKLGVPEGLKQRYHLD